MYIQWLLEFVWRIFIQGPLLLIDFFCKSANLNKFMSMIIFKDDYNIYITTFISIGVIIGFSAVILIAIFIYKMFVIIITNNGQNAKQLVFQALKEFAKSFVVLIVFVACFELLFTTFNSLSRSISEFYNKIASDKNLGNIDAIPEQLYLLITGIDVGDKNPNFLFPPTEGAINMDGINWLVSIILVNAIGFFIVWITWSIIQKMIEVIFLYFSFPVVASFGQLETNLNWKIWIKEIINKIVIIFVLLLFQRVFIYGTFFILSLLSDNKRGINDLWKRSNGGIYIVTICIGALGSSILFFIKLISVRFQEKIGIIGAISSFKQTKHFIQNSKQENIVNQTFNTKEDEAKINEKINHLKIDLSNNINNQNFKQLEKVKLFNK